VSEKKEYIEREALKEKAEIIRKKMLTEKHEPLTVDIMNDFADLLDQYAKDIPSADVESVVRGEWVEMRDPYGDLTGWIHESCGRETNFASEYCSKCGAKMTFVERSANVQLAKISRQQTDSVQELFCDFGY